MKITLESLKGLLLDFNLKRCDEQKAKKLDSGERVGAAYMSDTCSESAYLSDGRNKQRPEPRGKKPHCDFCGKDGHREAKCFKKKAEKQNSTGYRGSPEAHLGEGGKTRPRAVSFIIEVEPANSEKGDTKRSHTRGKEKSLVAEEKDLKVNLEKVKMRTTEVDFVTNSGCTRFMMNSEEYFSSWFKLEHPVRVTLANGSSTQATHKAAVDLLSNRGCKVTLTDVLYVPELRRNLMSVRRITQKGFHVLFTDEAVLITKGKDTIAEGYVEGNLFHMRLDVCHAEVNSAETSLSYQQIHRRLGHPSLEVALKLRSNGLLSFGGDGNRLCEPCIKGKLCQSPYPKSTFRTSKVLEQIVSDVCQAPTRSYDGYDYFVTFLDVFSHFSMVYLLRNKSEVFKCFVEYEALVRAQFGYGIYSFLCDNGREFMNGEFVGFCKGKGIRILNSVPYNHQQNGKAERLNRTLEDRCRTILSDSGLPKIFWSEAILYSTYSLNRYPMLGTGKTPAAEWFGGDIGYHKLRPFGCVAYAHIAKEKRKKLDDRASKGIMVGYAPLACRIYELKAKVS